MPRSKETVKSRISKLIQQNANLFTGIVAVVILVLGFVLVQAPSKIWVAGLSLLALAVIAFLLFNGRVFLKATIAVVVLCVSADYGFRLGSTADSSGKWAGFWLLSLVLLWAICLSITYFRPSLTSRWIVMAILPIFHFLFAIWLMLVTKNVGLSLGIAIPVTLLAFLLAYYTPTFVRAARMFPKPSESFFPDGSTSKSDEFVNALLDANWGVWQRKTRRGETLVVWNDTSVYQLVRLPLDQAFAFNKRLRKTYLSYRNRNANAALFELVRKVTPMSGTGNADLMTIIVDQANANGPRPRTLGISIPDTKKLVPIGVMPARNFFNAKNVPETFRKLDGAFAQFTTELTPKQRFALDCHLPMDITPREWDSRETAVDLTPEEETKEGVATTDSAVVPNVDEAAKDEDSDTSVVNVAEGIVLDGPIGAHAATNSPRKPQPSKTSRKKRSRNR